LVCLCHQFSDVTQLLGVCVIGSVMSLTATMSSSQCCCNCLMCHYQCSLSLSKLIISNDM